MWETIRAYLTFTRKERFGILFLLLLISVLLVLPYLFRQSPGDPDPAGYEKFKEGIRHFESLTSDSAKESRIHDRYQDHPPSSYDPTVRDSFRPVHAELFYFDPNKISVPDWQRLGLSERPAQTIRHYLDKGGRFHKAEDLIKLYGLRPSDYERLAPYVRNIKPLENGKTQTGYDAKSAYNNLSVKRADSFFMVHPSQSGSTINRMSRKKLEKTDINQADSVAWSLLPGIGEKLASRIIHFRERLGGFFQVDQVAETFGLPDSTFQKIKPCLRLGAVSLIPIDLNIAGKKFYRRILISAGSSPKESLNTGFSTVDLEQWTNFYNWHSWIL